MKRQWFSVTRAGMTVSPGDGPRSRNFYNRMPNGIFQISLCPEVSKSSALLRVATKSGLMLRFNRANVKMWLGWQGSNLRMAIPKTAALPLGYTPSLQARCITISWFGCNMEKQETCPHVKNGIWSLLAPISLEYSPNITKH